MPIGSYEHPDTYRYPRTQSRVMAAKEWEGREQGFPRPLWHDYAAAAGVLIFIWLAYVFLPAIVRAM